MTVVRNRAIDRVRARRATVDVDAADELSLLRTGPNPTWEDALGRAQPVTCAPRSPSCRSSSAAPWSSPTSRDTPTERSPS